MAKNYDVIVLGSGSVAGAVIAKAREAGWKIALVECRPLGGTCALRGCHPKKMLRSGAEALDWIGRMEGKGLKADGAHINWSDLQTHKRSETDPLPEAFEQRYRKDGVDIYHGEGKFIDERTVEAAGEKISAEKAPRKNFTHTHSCAP